MDSEFTKQALIRVKDWCTANDYTLPEVTAIAIAAELKTMLQLNCQKTSKMIDIIEQESKQSYQSKSDIQKYCADHSDSYREGVKAGKVLFAQQLLGKYT